MTTKSWVIVKISTGKAVYEFFNEKFIDIVNTEKYKVLPILDYLYQFNSKIKGIQNEKINQLVEKQLPTL